MHPSRQPRSFRPLMMLLALLLPALLLGPSAVAQPGSSGSGPGNPFAADDPFAPENAAPAEQAPPIGGASELFGDSRDQVDVRVVPRQTTVPPGADLPVAIIFDHAPGWHVYAAQMPIPEGYYRTIVTAEVETDGAPIEVHPGFIQWPASKSLEFFGDTVHVYEGKAIAHLPLTVAADAEPGEYTVRVRASFQSCDDTQCLPPTPYPPAAGETPSEKWLNYGQTFTITVVPLEEATSADPASLGSADPSLFESFDPAVIQEIRAGAVAPEIVSFDLFGWVSFDIDVAGAGFFLLILVAAFGGFLLNLTPCVLPVIPIKIMGLSASAGNRGRMIALGTAMSLGVIAFWLALGAVIASIAGFTAANQLFQYPAFSITVGVIIAAMAVGMCGLFAVRLPNVVYSVSPKHDSMTGSFLFGIMTAVLSTPCTAPFMGAAAAYAATIEPARTMLVFAFIGLGMALPYQVLSMFPALVERMPRTGPASELIKQVMGLLMLAAAAYFLGTGVSGLMATSADPPSRLYLWIVAGFGAAAGLWLLVRTLRIAKKNRNRIAFGALGLLIAAISVYAGNALTDKGPIDWTYYTPARFAEAKDDGNVVVMEFTAEWCLNCKAMEATVLADDRVASALNGPGVVPIKVDLTGNNDVGNAMLKAVDRVTIPLIVVFSPDGTEVFKSDYYTVAQVLDAIEEASGKSSPALLLDPATASSG